MTHITKPVALIILFILPLCAIAQGALQLSFSSTPLIEMDDSANFKICGLQFRAKIDATNRNTDLNLVVVKDKNNQYIVSSQMSTLNNNSTWRPTNSVIQWIRIGNSEPIKLAPYDLITNPSVGFSQFSIILDEKNNPFVDLDKPTLNILTQIYDRETKEKTTYFGAVNRNPDANSIVRQCIQGLSNSPQQ